MQMVRHSVMKGMRLWHGGREGGREKACLWHEAEPPQTNDRGENGAKIDNPENLREA